LSGNVIRVKTTQSSRTSAEHNMATDPRVADLARSGAIRLALFLPQYDKNPVTGELRGLGVGYVAIEIARALAERLGIAMHVVQLPTPPTAIECIKTGSCDMAFLGIEPSRTALMDFSPAVVQFDYTYLVPAGSALRSAADADRPGTRVAVVRGHASTMALTRMVKHAELVGSDLPDTAFELLRAGEVAAFAAPREPLLEYAAKLPGSLVLEDRFGVNNVGIAIMKGRTERLSYIREFVDNAKASGLIARMIDSGGLSGFRVAL
jgi:polar amino acid transport system substrate-binding protein